MYNSLSILLTVEAVHFVLEKLLIQEKMEGNLAVKSMIGGQDDKVSNEYDKPGQRTAIQVSNEPISKQRPNSAHSTLERWM